MGVMLEPPTAECPLEEEQTDAHQCTGRDSEIVMQVESPMVEQHRADDTLHNVVGQTHATVWYDFLEQSL